MGKYASLNLANQNVRPVMAVLVNILLAFRVSWRLLGRSTHPSLVVVTLVNVSNNAPNATDSGVLGGWWFGASPSSPDSNFLRVHNAFPNRRLSDNALMMPPKIRIAPSCASSPGGTPGGGGLPIRRHSSIGPQERRGSTVNLSPPTVSMILLYHSLFCLGT